MKIPRDVIPSMKPVSNGGAWIDANELASIQLLPISWSANKLLAFTGAEQRYRCLPLAQNADASLAKWW
jgi:hypothetical protein